MSSEPKPSATVIVLRDSDALEVLLLRRNMKQGFWVFPGGKVDAGDGVVDGDDFEPVARRAAVREAAEEAGLGLDANTLVPISRWITPEVVERRFDTVFFAAVVAREQEIRVDGGEIAEHRWIAPQRALDAHRAKELRIAPPTFVTLCWLVEHARSEHALSKLRVDPIPVFRPQVHMREGSACVLYPGDAGYEARDPDLPGPRHRLLNLPDGLRYERS